MRKQIFAVAALLTIASCESKKSTTDQPPPGVEQSEKTAKKPTAPLTDITTASSFAAIRTAFNAHKGEARFLTLLSPT